MGLRWDLAQTDVVFGVYFFVIQSDRLVYLRQVDADSC